MAKVTNQQIPTSHIEEKTSPPIGEIDQYTKTLSQAINWQKLPPGQEIVTYSKKDARPRTRSNHPYYDNPVQALNRAYWQKCATCWHKQFSYESQVNYCDTFGSKHYFTPWHWIPGAKNTYYNVFMKDCMNWMLSTKGLPFPKCIGLTIDPPSFTFSANQQTKFNLKTTVYEPDRTAPPPTYPITEWADCGSIIAPQTWQAPSDISTCPNKINVYFNDAVGRKGCAQGTKQTIKHKIIAAICCTGWVSAAPGGITTLCNYPPGTIWEYTDGQIVTLNGGGWPLPSYGIKNPIAIGYLFQWDLPFQWPIHNDYILFPVSPL